MVTVLKLNRVHIKNGSVKPKERDFKMCEEIGRASCRERV